MDVMTAADRFESFGPTHLVLVGVFALGIPVVVRWGRSHRGTPAEPTNRRALAVALLLCAVPLQVYQLTPDDWDLGTSLPLQLCDLAWLTASYGLWTRSPRACAFTYYVGLSITIQGILTPSLAETFPDPRFFGFWGMHLLVVWSAVYLTWGLGLRPTRGLFAFTVAATATWALSAYLFNLVADTNYGYLNRLPPSASALDYLGPWPWYVFAEIGIVFAGWWFVMTLPWLRRQPVSLAGADH